MYHCTELPGNKFLDKEPLCASNALPKEAAAGWYVVASLLNGISNVPLPSYKTNGGRKQQIQSSIFRFFMNSSVNLPGKKIKVEPNKNIINKNLAIIIDVNI